MILDQIPYVRFDPLDETFEVFTLPRTEANLRQILGRTGEIWGAESGADKLSCYQYKPEMI